MSSTRFATQQTDDKIQCSICHKFFKTNGLKQHLTKAHPSAHLNVLSSACASSSVDSDIDAIRSLSELLVRARKVLPVLRNIPKRARSSIAQVYSEAIQAVLRDRNIQSWKRLLSCAYICLRDVPKFRRGRSIVNTILENVSEFRRGVSLEEVMSKYPDRGNRVANRHDQIRRLVSNKICEGDISGAARILGSEDSIVQGDPEIVAALSEKHPPAPSDIRPAPSSDISLPDVSPVELDKILLTLPSSSAAGLDGLRFAHIKQMISTDVTRRLRDQLCTLITTVIGGRLPQFILPLFYAASLTAIKKKDGGVRPIACGLSVRRLAAKILLKRLKVQYTEVLRPRQLGCGIPNGAESIVHAISYEISRSHQSDEPTVILKCDIRNAFNSLRRDWMLERVKELLPELLPHAAQAYGQDSYLRGDGISLMSSCGVQQGDPAGPLLFCLGIHPLVRSLCSPVSSWYLDDGVLVGDADVVTRDIQTIKDFEEMSGLQLNFSKCEVSVVGGSERARNEVLQRIRHCLPSVTHVTLDSLEILGAPVSKESAKMAFAKRARTLERLCANLHLLSSQEALLLLRLSLFVPRITYLLRCVEDPDPDQLQDCDRLLKDTLECILNIRLDDNLLAKATLPIRLGGLGVRLASELAGPCYISSVVSAKENVQHLLNPEHGFAEFADAKLDAYTSARLLDDPSIEFSYQKSIDRFLCQRKFESLLNSATTNEEKALLLSSVEPLSTSWLRVLPNRHTGTLLPNNTFRMSVGLKLGADVCEEHNCVSCGAPVSSKGRHGLCCRYSRGRHSRHSAMNEEIARTLASVHVPSRREPVGLLPDPNLRPDGATIIPWARGRYAAWDATVVDTLAPSYVSMTASTPGKAADRAEQEKRNKYKDLSPAYDFFPLGFETMGAMGSGTKDFLDQLRKRMVNTTGGTSSWNQLLQRLSLILVRGNAACLMGTMTTTDGECLFETSS